MEFKEVSTSDLILNNRYQLNWHGHESIGIYIRKKDNLYTFHFRTITITSNYCNCLFYQPIFKGQQSMEQRSLNLILRKILGDPYFVWIQ